MDGEIIWDSQTGTISDSSAPAIGKFVAFMPADAFYLGSRKNILRRSGTLSVNE